MTAPTVISPGWTKETSPLSSAEAPSKGAANQNLTPSGRGCPDASLPTALNWSLLPTVALDCSGVTSTVATLETSSGFLSFEASSWAKIGRMGNAVANESAPMVQQIQRDG